MTDFESMLEALIESNATGGDLALRLVRLRELGRTVESDLELVAVLERLSHFPKMEEGQPAVRPSVRNHGVNSLAANAGAGTERNKLLYAKFEDEILDEYTGAQAIIDLIETDIRPVLHSTGTKASTLGPPPGNAENELIARLRKAMGVNRADKARDQVRRARDGRAVARDVRAAQEDLPDGPSNDMEDSEGGGAGPVP